MEGRVRAVRARRRVPWGPHAARKYQFVARGVAEALVAVGAGSTYRDAAGVARERARRLRVDQGSGELGFSRHGSLVMDWVEVFAPGVFEAYRPREWPTCPSGCVTQIAVGPESLSGCSPRWGMTADARGCGVWRHSRPSPSLTGRRFCARSVALRHGSFATTTPCSRTRSVLASPRPSYTCASGTCATRWSG